MSISISELPALGAQPNNASYFPIVEGGITKRVTYANLIDGLGVIIPDTLSMFIPLNSGLLNEHLFGSYSVLASGQSLSSGAPLNLTGGVGHIGFSVNAGTDIAGAITIEGTSVTHADTGDETESDSESITVDSLSSNDSDTDAVGNTRVSLTNGYLSSKLWKGAVAISTTNLALSDLLVFQIFTNHVIPGGTIKDFEVLAHASNTNAWFYGYLYGLTRDTVSKKLNIERIASFELPAADISANQYYTNLVTNINFTYNEAHGFFAQLFFGPGGQTYWSEINTRLELSYSVSLANL